MFRENSEPKRPEIGAILSFKKTSLWLFGILHFAFALLWVIACESSHQETIRSCLVHWLAKREG